MNVNELRRLNLVNYQGVVKIVNSISISMVGLSYRMNIDEFEYANIPIKNIKPIPLTEEILLKCGFEYDTLDWLYLRRKRFNFCTDRSVNMGVVYVNINGCDLGLELEYLHQLQNLYFALTQKELEINL